MAQVTYTVGLLDASSTVVYNGTLELQLDISNVGTTAQAGLLSLDGFQPLLLTAVNGGGQAWTLYGGNASLSVETTALYPAVQQLDQAPSYIAGSLALTPAGQADQNLLLLGTDVSAAAAAAPQAAAQADAPGAAEAVAGIPPVNYNFALQLMDASFGAAGSGTFTGTGAEAQIGPVSRQWMVRGSLVLDGGEAIAIQGWGTSQFWYGRGSDSAGTEVDLGFVAQTFIPGSADGTVTTGTQTRFFVGTPVSAATVPVQGIATPAAEPA